MGQKVRLYSTVHHVIKTTLCYTVAAKYEICDNDNTQRSIQKKHQVKTFKRH